MATHRWIGREGNDFALAASWATDGGAGTAPSGWGETDTVIFGDDSPHSAFGDLSHPTIDVDLILIGENYPGDVGAPSNPLTINANKIVHQGSGTLYFDNHSDVIGIAPDTTDEIIIAYTGDQSGLAASIRGGKITTLAASRGLVEITDLETTSLLVLSFTKNRTRDTLVRLFNTSSAIAELMAVGGRLEIGGAADITSMHLTSCHVVNESSALSSATVRIYSGLVEWNTAITIARAELYNGTLDLTGSAEAKVITLLWQFPDTVFRYLPDLTTFTRVDLDGLTVTEG